MPKLKDLIQKNLQNLRTNVNKAATEEEKLAAAREGLRYAIAYQNILDQYDDDAADDIQIDANSNEFQEALKNVREDAFLNSRIDRIDDVNVIIDNAENIEDVLPRLEKRKETYENTKQEVNNALSGFAEKEDYREMVDYVTGITSNTDDGLYDAKSQAINEYFKELTSVEHDDDLDDDDGLDEEDEKVFRGFAEEFALRNAEAGVKAIEDAQGIENDFADGGYEGAELIGDDKELHQKLSQQIVLNQFAIGKTVRAFDTAAKLILGGNGKVDGMGTTEYLTQKRNDAMTLKYNDTFPVQDDETELQKRGQAVTYMLTPPSIRADIDGFVVSTDLNKFFDKIPEEHDRLLKMSEDELLLEEQRELDKLTRLTNAKTEFTTIRYNADQLIKELENMPVNKMQLDGFDRLYAELKNFNHFGTTNYIHKGNPIYPENCEYASEEDRLTPEMANKALDRLSSSAEEFAKSDPDFGKKVAAYIWEKRECFKSDLKAGYDPKKLDMIKKVKKIKHIENRKADPDKVYYKDVKKLPEKLNTVIERHNGAKLTWRGSNEYKQIGIALTTLDAKFKELLAAEQQGRENNTINDEAYQRDLRDKAAAVKEQLKTLKEWTNAYYSHKVKDGQWKKGTNSNADKRIEVVEAIDELAIEIGENIDKRINLSDDIIRKKAADKPIDYDTWCDLYPKEPSEYKETETMPEGLKKFDETVKGFKDLNVWAWPLAAELKEIGYEYLNDDYKELIDDINACFLPKNVLQEDMKMPPDDWNKSMQTDIPKLKKLLTEDDNFDKIMLAYEKVQEKYGDGVDGYAPDHFINAMKALNKLFKADIPVDELKKNYDFKKDIKTFEEQAIDIYARGIVRGELDNYLENFKKDNPNITKEEIAQYYKDNSYEDYAKTEKCAQLKESIKNSGKFKEFMKTVTSPEKLREIKEMGKNNDGAELYDYMDGLKFLPVDLNAQLANAQQQLTNAKASLNDHNAFPDKNKFSKQYAAIMAVHNIKDNSAKIPTGQTITVKDFEKLVDGMAGKDEFKTMMNVRDDKTLYSNATTGNGKGLTIDKPKAVADYKDIAQNNHNRGKHNPVVSQLNNILNKKP